jgi:hypothetical protein
MTGHIKGPLLYCSVHRVNSNACSGVEMYYVFKLRAPLCYPHRCCSATIYAKVLTKPPPHKLSSANVKDDKLSLSLLLLYIPQAGWHSSPSMRTSSTGSRSMTGAVSLRRSWNRRLDTTPCVLKQGGISLKKLVENQNNHRKTQVSFQFKSGSSSVVDLGPYDFEPSGIQILHYLY